MGAGTPAYETNADDGWIEWKGGERPIHAATLVRVKLRSGSVWQWPAGSCRWEHAQPQSDIVAYKVLP